MSIGNPSRTRSLRVIAVWLGLCILLWPALGHAGVTLSSLCATFLTSSSSGTPSLAIARAWAEVLSSTLEPSEDGLAWLSRIGEVESPLEFAFAPPNTAIDATTGQALLELHSLVEALTAQDSLSRPEMESALKAEALKLAETLAAGLRAEEGSHSARREAHLAFRVLDTFKPWAASASFSPDGLRLLIRRGNRHLEVRNLEGATLATIESRKDMRRAVFNRDGSGVLIASRDEPIRHKLLNGPTATTIRLPEGASSAEFSPDGSRIVTASNDRFVRIWDLKGKRIARIEVFRSAARHVRFAAFDPSGERVVTVGSDGYVRVWRLDGTEIAAFYHPNSVLTVQFSADGSKVLTSCHDGVARIWDLQGAPVVNLTGHKGALHSAEFSADGSRIATAAEDHTARIWSPDGTLLATLEGHKGPVYTAAFSPMDANTIVTASQDGTIRLWEVDLWLESRGAAGLR